MKAVSLFGIFLLFCVTFHCSLASQDQYCADCLRLTPFVRNGSTDAARRLAEVDSSKFLNIKSYSGFITVNDDYDSNLFFWFFPVESKLSTTPVIIWLQGGPGYTSLKGLFDIIGPLQLEDDKVTKKPVTWASDYSLIFLDQPVGTGYSFTQDKLGYTENEDDVGAHMHEFLVQFLEIFPELKKAPLFIMGESYAGKYVPALAIQVHRKKDKHPINLRGIAIGNGLIDPISMMHYTEFCRILGLLDDKQVGVLNIIEQDTIKAIEENRMLDAALKMQPDMMNTTKPFVEELLEHYGVMCYSGQLDVILPYGLSRNLYSKLNWSRRPEYIKASRRRLRNATDESIVAFKKSGGNFAEVLIRRAGHMVPQEQPNVAKFVIDRFIDEYK